MAKQKTFQAREVPVEWHVSDDVPVRYATNLVVQRLENEYLLSFFEVRPPIVLGNPEQMAAKVDVIESVRADCVAQIFVAENKIPEFVKTLQANLEKGFVLSGDVSV